MRDRRKCIEKSHKSLSVRRQCELLQIHRSGLDYKAKGEKAENTEMMRLMDAHYLDVPTAGVLTMQTHLQEQGYRPSCVRIRRLMRLMGLVPVYPKKNLSKLGSREYIHPYLLKGLDITAANAVWAIDITYIPMQQGFMYLTAIIDLYSRYVVGWDISNTLDAASSLRVAQAAVKRYGPPGIINSDQGSQFTCKDWVEYLKSQDITISMDGKGRAIDNVYIERLWRSLKYEHVYLRPAQDVTELYKGLKQYFEYYNHRRPHQGIDRLKPVHMYKQAA